MLKNATRLLLIGESILYCMFSGYMYYDDQFFVKLAIAGIVIGGDPILM